MALASSEIAWENFLVWCANTFKVLRERPHGGHDRATLDG